MRNLNYDSSSSRLDRCLRLVLEMRKRVQMRKKVLGEDKTKTDADADMERRIERRMERQMREQRAAKEEIFFHGNHPILAL